MMPGEGYIDLWYQQKIVSHPAAMFRLQDQELHHISQNPIHFDNLAILRKRGFQIH